jgi:hypothetical protein
MAKFPKIVGELLQSQWIHYTLILYTKIVAQYKVPDTLSGAQNRKDKVQ